MQRLREHVPHWSRLYDPAGVHHEYPIGEARNCAQTVTHEEERESHSATQLLKQIDDLSLRQGVERGGGFVGDQHPGSGSDGLGDGHALALAAAQLVRIRPRELRIETDALQKPTNSVPLGGTTRAPVTGDDVGDLSAGAPHRIEGEPRFLKDRCENGSPHGPQVRLGGSDQLSAFEKDRSTKRSGARQQARQRARQACLSRTRLPDDRDGLPGL
jgi:hypothetical protein